MSVAFSRPARPYPVEGEAGLAQVDLRPDVYQWCGAAVYGGPAVVNGRAERHGGGVSRLGA